LLVMAISGEQGHTSRCYCSVACSGVDKTCSSRGDANIRISEAV
jgi:hypothetical protein